MVFSRCSRCRSRSVWHPSIYTQVYPDWTCGARTPNRGGTLQHPRGLNPWRRVQQPSIHCTLVPEGFWTPDQGFLSNPSNQLYPMALHFFRLHVVMKSRLFSCAMTGVVPWQRHSLQLTTILLLHLSWMPKKKCQWIAVTTMDSI